MAPRKAKEAASTSTVTLPLAGLLCKENCGPNVERALRGVNGVKSATVDFENSSATITLHKPLPTQQHDAEQVRRLLVDAVVDAGYEVVMGDEEGGQGLPLGGVGLGGGSATTTTTTTTSTSTVSMRISGMTCQSCVRTASAALRKVPGVMPSSVDVSLAQGGIATLAYSGPSQHPLVQAVQAVGFEASILSTATATPPHISIPTPIPTNTSVVVTPSGRSVGAMEVTMDLARPPTANANANTALPITRQQVSKVRNSLRATPGVVCALVDVRQAASYGDTTQGQRLVARVRVRSAEAASSLVTLVQALGYEALAVSILTPQPYTPSKPQALLGREKALTLTRGGGEGEGCGHLGDATAILDVKGMTCGACVSTLESALSKAPGVVRAKVALLSEKAEVLFDSQATKAETLRDLVDSIGYDATLVKVVREDGLKAETGTFVVQLPATGLAEALEAWPGVLSVALQPLTKSKTMSSTLKHKPGLAVSEAVVVVRYEQELVGLRDLLHAMDSQGFRARLAPASLCPSAPSLSDKQNLQLDEARLRLGVAFALTLPIMLLSMTPLPPHSWLSSSLVPGLPVRDVLLLLLATAVQLGPSGVVFYVEAYKGLRGGSYGMALLVAMGTTASYAFALFSQARSVVSGGVLGGQPDFFMTSAMLLSFITLGKWLELLAKRRTSRALTKLLDVQAKKAVLVHEEEGTTSTSEEEIPVELVQIGDTLKVVRGAKVPADGEVVRGEGFVDEALITGESMPVAKRTGDRVIGGSLNTEGLFWMRVSGVGEDSVLKQIVRLMEDAQMSKAPIQAMADRIAGSFALVVLCLSLLTFVLWLTLLSFELVPESWIPLEYRNSHVVLAFTLAVSTMVIACPCAMGLATPTAIMVGTGVGASHGVLIKGGEALEKANRLSAVVFDKTGTLTMGQPTVAHFNVLNSHLDWGRVVWAVASAETASEHPLGKSIVKFALENASTVPPLVTPTELHAVSGKGLRCRVLEEEVVVGTGVWMREMGVTLASDTDQRAAKVAEDLGKIVVTAALNGVVVAFVEILDQPRPEALQVLRALRQDLHLKVFMVTGDNRRTAAEVGSRLGIPPEAILAETLPSNKVAKIRELQSQGHVVAMVGDGINDAPALAQADLGIAIGAGTDIACEAADMVLVKSDLRSVLTCVHLSRVIVRRIYLNLLWAFAYNAIGIPLAAGLLMPVLHTAIPPYVAGLAMALSSVSVLLSSLTLKWYRPPRLATANASHNPLPPSPRQPPSTSETSRLLSISGPTTYSTLV